MANESTAVKIARLEEGLKYMVEVIGGLKTSMGEINKSVVGGQKEQNSNYSKISAQLTRINTNVLSQLSSHNNRLERIEREFLDHVNSNAKNIAKLSEEVQLNTQLRDMFEFAVKWRQVIIPGLVFIGITAVSGGIVALVSLFNYLRNLV